MRQLYYFLVGSTVFFGVFFLIFVSEVVKHGDESNITSRTVLISLSLFIVAILLTLIQRYRIRPATALIEIDLKGARKNEFSFREERDPAVVVEALILVINNSDMVEFTSGNEILLANIERIRVYREYSRGEPKLVWQYPKLKKPNSGR